MVPGASESHELQRTIDALHSRYKPLTDGDVATYIPELAKANPERLRHLHRDRRRRRSSRPATATARSPSSRSPSPSRSAWPSRTYGHETVAQARRRRAERRRVQLDRAAERARTGRHNPMINAGAITVTALLHARYGDEAFDHDPRPVQRRGRPPARRSIEAVYESERRTGHRNRAIAHLLLNFGLVHDDAERPSTSTSGSARFSSPAATWR